MAEPAYTVFVRVPMPRGDFVDPPPVHWDAAKDEALWKILSGAAQTDIDWIPVAERFDVPVDFLLQQVAYLTERHASQVRAQVLKATAAARGSAAPSPVPGSDQPRTTSALSVRRDSPMPLAGSGRPLMSRNASANTTVLRDAGGSTPRLSAGAAPGRPAEQQQPSGRRRLSSLPQSSPPATKSADPAEQQRSSPGPAESNSGPSSEDEGSSPAQSRIIRRPPRFQQQEASQSYQDGGGGGDEDDDGVDDDDELEPAFQPYQAKSGQVSPPQDMASTLKGDGGGGRAARRSQGSAKDGVLTTLQSQTSDSSAGSAAVIHRPAKARDPRPAGPLSPRRAAELAGRSPSKGKAASRDGSDGALSMGSSFSDLEDASVTQSALEEALASQINRGAMSSRFSISQAFRSRYNPGSNH